MNEFNLDEITAVFGRAIKNAASDLADLWLEESTSPDISGERIFSVIISIAGLHRGRVLMQISSELVRKITDEMNREPVNDLTDISLCIGEFLNIACSRAISSTSDGHFLHDLRLSPPVIFSGKNMHVVTPAIQSEVIFFRCHYGVLGLDIGFERRRK